MTRREFLMTSASGLGGMALASPIRSSLGGRLDTLSEAQGYTAADYVQDGLVAMWDGIENVGWDIHDSATPTWRGLVGGEDLLILSGGSWGADYLESDGISVAVLQQSNVLMSIFRDMRHFQTVFSAPFTQSTSNRLLIHYRETSQVGRLRCGCSRSPGITRPLINLPLDISTSNSVISYACTSFPNANTVEGVWVNGQFTSLIGTYGGGEFGNGLSIGGANDNYNRANCSGRVYCLRIYSRTLEQDEISYNYAIDKIRFNLPD